MYGKITIQCNSGHHNYTPGSKVITETDRYTLLHNIDSGVHFSITYEINNI